VSAALQEALGHPPSGALHPKTRIAIEEKICGGVWVWLFFVWRVVSFPEV